MRLIDVDALMLLFVEKANTMKDRHGVKAGDSWLLNYEDIKDVVDNAPTVKLTDGGPDRFTLEELRAWLYENAFNNYGTQYEKDVVEIINRLDGFVRFCKDRRSET